MLINEIVTQEELEEIDEKASRKLCLSTKPNAKLGASNLSSCKAQGLRARTSDKAYSVNKKKEKMAGKKIKGKKYGGPLEDWGGYKK